MINNLYHSSFLRQGKSVGPQVYKLLRDKIIQGELAPGARISEAEISKVLEVSRQPVREAFIKLRNDGLVEVRPQRGTFVTKIHVNAVSDARFIREAIEVEIIRLLAESCQADQIRLLRENIAEQRRASTVDVEKFFNLDEAFHRLLADFAGKGTVWDVIGRLKAHFDRVRYVSSSHKPLDRVIDHHVEIVNALEKHDAQQAEQVIRDHMREVLIDLPQIMKQQPDIFAEQGTIR